MPTLFDAINLLSQVPITKENLTEARSIVAMNRILPIDIDLAILAMAKGDMVKATNHINGPSGRGSGLGAIKDLQKILEAK
jgi:hypothetical protein